MKKRASILARRACGYFTGRFRSYVEQFGHGTVIERAGIKSRTSDYRSLRPNTTPSFGTLVQLGHAIIELAKDNAPAT